MIESLVLGTILYFFLKDSLPARAAPFLAVLAAAADNITTWIAVASGAGETNPVVAFFLQSPVAYVFFAAAKTLMVLMIARVAPRTGIWAAMVFFTASWINSANILLAPASNTPTGYSS